MRKIWRIKALRYIVTALKEIIKGDCVKKEVRSEEKWVEKWIYEKRVYKWCECGKLREDWKETYRYWNKNKRVKNKEWRWKYWLKYKGIAHKEKAR